MLLQTFSGLQTERVQAAPAGQSLAVPQQEIPPSVPEVMGVKTHALIAPRTHVPRLHTLLLTQSVLVSHAHPDVSSIQLPVIVSHVPIPQVLGGRLQSFGVPDTQVPLEH
jgi:hypothetical protein